MDTEVQGLNIQGQCFGVKEEATEKCLPRWPYSSNLAYANIKRSNIILLKFIVHKVDNDPQNSPF